MMKKHLSIRIQLIFTLVTIVLPVVLWAVALSFLLLQSARERVRDAYQNELVLYQQGIDRITEKLNMEMDSYLIQYQPQLYSSAKIDVMTNIEMVSGLKAVWQRNELVRGAWLAGKDGASLAITSDKEAVDFEIYQMLKEKLAGEAFYPDSSQVLADCLFDGSWYWFWVYPYGESVVGFFAPMNTVLEDLLVTDSREKKTLFLQDTEGQVLAMAGEDLSGGKQAVFEQPLAYTEVSLCMAVPRSQVRMGLPTASSFLLIFSLFLVVAIPLLWFLIRRILLNPLEKVRGAMEQIELEHMDYQLDETEMKSLEMQYVARQFNHMVQQIEELKIEQYETELEKREIEAVNLRLQINPHLLLNSLNLIFSLSQIPDNLTIQRFTKYLADYFQYSLRNTDAMVPLREEIRFVRNYMEIQKIRYPGRFLQQYDLDEKALERKIPSLLVENLVENSIKYGLKMGEQITIGVYAGFYQEDLEIIVEDNGNGMAEDTLELLRSGEIVENRTGKHIGLWNIRRRLQLAYGDRAQLRIESGLGKGTRISIRIPGEVEDDTADCR